MLKEMEMAALGVILQELLKVNLGWRVDCQLTWLTSMNLALLPAKSLFECPV